MHHVQLSGRRQLCDRQLYFFHHSQNIEIVPTSGKGKTISLLTATNPLGNATIFESTVGTPPTCRRQGRLILPPDKAGWILTPTKYPAQSTCMADHIPIITTTAASDARGWDIYMAQLGYVVLMLTTRAVTTGTGIWELYVPPIGNQKRWKGKVKGGFLKIIWVYVDNNRISITWFGASVSSTTNDLTCPELFQVGVAGGPVSSNWTYCK